MTKRGPCTMRSTDPLLQPFAIRHLVLRNRIVSTSHEPAYAQDSLPTDRYRAYHVERAKGGTGLLMVGGSAVVSPDSPPSFGNLQLHREEITPWLEKLTSEIHEHGAAVMCQITHLGRRTSNYSGDWLPVPYPSAMREPAHRAFPKIAEEWDLHRIAADYAAAAVRCRDAGMDGVEIQSYGHFMDAFPSPATKTRTDAWGGSFENRLAFPLLVINAVRAAVGADFIVGIRMSMDEDREHGLGRTEALAALAALAALRRYTGAGSGITPLMSITRHLLQGGQPVDAVLLYSAYEPAEVIFHRELRSIPEASGLRAETILGTGSIPTLGTPRTPVRPGTWTRCAACLKPWATTRHGSTPKASTSLRTHHRPRPRLRWPGPRCSASSSCAAGEPSTARRTASSWMRRWPPGSRCPPPAPRGCAAPASARCSRGRWR